MREKPKQKDRGLFRPRSLVLGQFNLFMQTHECVAVRSVRKHRQEAEQYEQTNQGRNENHEKQGHDNLLSRVENSFLYNVLVGVLVPFGSIFLY